MAFRRNEPRVEVYVPEMSLVGAGEAYNVMMTVRTRNSRGVLRKVPQKLIPPNCLSKYLNFRVFECPLSRGGRKYNFSPRP
jgi:hypothetical protein